MARKANGKGEIRARLEGALGALVTDWHEVLPYVELRLNQAMRREPGLQSLLGPVLEDLQRMTRGVTDAESQVRSAMVKLMER